MKRALTIMFILAVSILTQGCGQKQPVRRLEVAIDYSGSMFEKMPSGMTLIEENKGRINYAIDSESCESTVNLYKFRSKPILESSKKPKNANEYVGVINKIIAEGATDDKGTYLAPILQQFLVDAQSSDLPTYGVIITDGECFDAGETYKAAEQLANQSNFHYLLIGPVNADINLDLQNRIFAKLKAAGKLRVCTMDDFQSGFDAFKDAEDQLGETEQGANHE